MQADQRVLRNLVTNFLPNIDQVLREHDIELALISANWFLTLFASVVHMKVLMRVWDLFFFEGSITLFQVTLGMLKNRGDILHWICIIINSIISIHGVESNMVCLENSAQIFNALSDIPGDVEDVEQLLEVGCTSKI